MFGITKHKKWHKVTWSNIIEINAPLELQDIRDILRVKDTIEWIQVYIPKQYKIADFEETWKLLNDDFFTIRPELALRVYSHAEGTFKNLSFLKYLTNLKKLILFEWLIEDLTPLVYLTNLESLSIADIKSKNISYAPLGTLTHLKSLHITGTKKDMEIISTLKNLEELALSSVKIDSLALLLPLHKLQKLRIMLGGIRNFELLPKIGKINYLEIIYIRMLPEVALLPIAQMPYLTKLELRNLGYIKTFTWLNGADKLEELSIDTLFGLESLEGIDKLPQLKKFFVVATKMKDKSIDALLRCKNIQELGIPPMWGKTNILMIDSHFPHLKLKQHMSLLFEKNRLYINSRDLESDSKIN